MQTYINQLVEDLNEKAQTKIEAPDYKLLNPDHPAIEYGLDYIVALECAPDLTYFEVFEIPNEAFPPMEKLNEEQAKQVVEAILNLLEINNSVAELPNPFPPYKLIYRELRRKWLEDTIRIIGDDDSTTHLEFCHYVTEQCPWGTEFCMCKDNEWEMSNEEIDRAIEKHQNSSNGEDLPL